MPDFSEQFTGYLIPSVEAIRSAMQSGQVVFDTNVLLNAYRFAPQAREQLLLVLESLRDRAWIPHQVAFEFHKNRIDVIAENDSMYKPILDGVDEHQQRINSEIGDKLRQLANRAALPDDERDQVLELLSNCLSSLRDQIKSLQSSHDLVNSAAEDSVLIRMQEIFKQRVGEPFNEDEAAEAQAESEKRIAERIPPGFRDAGRHGDYFLWKQVLAEMARRRPENLLLVTDDVKEDWYLRVKGKTLSARPELAIECEKATGARLILIQTKTLLRHASKYLNVSVSDDTLRQAETVAFQHELNHLERELQDAQEVSRILQNRMEQVQAAVDEREFVLRAAIERRDLAKSRHYEHPSFETEEALNIALSDASAVEQSIDRLRNTYDELEKQSRQVERRIGMLAGEISFSTISGERVSGVHTNSFDA